MMQGVAIALESGVETKHSNATLGIHTTAAQELVAVERLARSVKGQGCYIGSSERMKTDVS
jgi:hypothetical protein